ncbi:MAG: hypothetical protein IJU54_02485 [Alphaproteobacteria bacterium]|nr:hypothetical protein [Alphaproteobacteria bacterium]
MNIKNIIATVAITTGLGFVNSNCYSAQMLSDMLTSTKNQVQNIIKDPQAAFQGVKQTVQQNKLLHTLNDKLQFVAQPKVHNTISQTQTVPQQFQTKQQHVQQQPPVSNNLSTEIQQLRQTVNNLQNRVQVLEGYAKQIREMNLQPQMNYTPQYRYGNNHQRPIQPQQQMQANKSPVYTANTHTAQYHQQNNNQYNQYKKGWSNIPNQQYSAPSNITYNQQYGYVYR